MSIDHRSSLPNQILTVCAISASLAALSSAIAIHASQQETVIGVWSFLWGSMIVATVLLRRLSTGLSQMPAVTPIFLALAVIPYLWEGVSRAVWGTGLALEIVLLSSVQLTACGMAATSCWNKFQPLTMVAGLFVTLFASCVSQDRSTHIWTGLFVLFGLFWLVLSHWSALAVRIPHANRRQRPKFFVWIALAGTLSVAFSVAAIRSDETWALVGFIPSSGGDGLHDATASRGVGDGEALVAGQDHIQSFGPIENAPFRTSEDPSLYDLFNDLYDEPVKIKNQQRAIPLPPDKQNQIESRMATSERAGKEFSTVRKHRNRPADQMHSLHSDALLYVKGRVPLHLRQELFGRFDGIAWHAVEPTESSEVRELSLKKLADRPWICWPDRPKALEYFGPIENHTVKVLHLKSDRIPSPLNLLGVHIDQVDCVDFFRVVGDQLVALETETLPDLTSIHLRSRTVDWTEIARPWYWVRSQTDKYTSVPNEEFAKRIGELAKDWTKNLPYGWPQIDAVLRRLRIDYVLDANARPPEDTDDPIAYFLFESRRGPDYQFATSAALILRTLGYPTRLVSGFYASPARYDRLKRHTAVVGADAHVWVEVCHSPRNWLTLEPTPGYEVLAPPMLWWQQALATVWSLGTMIAANWPTCIAIVFLIFIVSVTRAWWMDRLAVAVWICLPARAVRTRLRQTVRLVEFRLWIAGRRRMPGHTWTRTLQRMAPLCPVLDQYGPEFIRLADWAVFAPVDEPMPATSSIPWNETCQQFVTALPSVLWSRRSTSDIVERILSVRTVATC